MLEVNLEEARRQMVEQQVRSWSVLDPEVVRVMAELPRDRYTPAPYRNLAYADSTIPIGHGEIMLQPSVHGRMLQAVQVQEGERVLEVGTGTGYLTACLAALGGHVRSVEIHEDFVQGAREMLTAEGFAQVEVAREDAHLLPSGGSEWDVIVVTGSLPVREPSFTQSLALNGRLLWIIGEAPAMRVELVTRVGADEWRREGQFETVVPALAGAVAPRRFQF